MSLHKTYRVECDGTELAVNLLAEKTIRAQAE